MRFSLLTVGAFAAGSLAAPVVSVEKRQISNVLQIFEGLYKQVTSLTGAINATVDVASSVNVDAAGVDLANVTATVKTDVATIVEIVGTVLNQTQNLTNLSNVGGVINIITGLTSGLPVVGSLTSKRQANVDVSAVVNIVTKLVSEVTATVGKAGKVVPAGELNQVIEPLTATLNNLLDDLENVVEGLLSLVNGVLRTLPITNTLNLKIDV